MGSKNSTESKPVVTYVAPPFRPCGAVTNDDYPQLVLTTPPRLTRQPEREIAVSKFQNNQPVFLRVAGDNIYPALITDVRVEERGIKYTVRCNNETTSVWEVENRLSTDMPRPLPTAPPAPRRVEGKQMCGNCDVGWECHCNGKLQDIGTNEFFDADIQEALRESAGMDGAPVQGEVANIWNADAIRAMHANQQL